MALAYPESFADPDAYNGAGENVSAGLYVVAEGESITERVTYIGFVADTAAERFKQSQLARVYVDGRLVAEH